MKLGDKIAQRSAFGKALVELGAQYENLVVLDADVAQSTQTHLFEKAYPERFFQIGIAEQNMTGIAAGLSTQGYIPFISAFAVFLTHRGGDQIRNSIAYPESNVKINGAYCGLPTGRAGGSHSCFEDLAIMRAMPNMVIFDPADAREVQLFTKLAIETQGPVYLRTVRCETPVIFDESHTVTLGKAIYMTEGTDITIISSGMMTARAKEAVVELEAKGISVEHIHMPTIKPIDKEAIAKTAAKTGKIITMENHSVIGGLGSAVCEAVAESVPCNVYRCGFQDIFLESGDDEVLFDRYGLSVSAVVKKVCEVLNK